MSDEISPETVGIVMAIVIAILRVMYDRKETAPARIVMEGALCGCLTVASNAGINAMGWDPQWAIFAGAMIGYLGSMTIRLLALGYLKKKGGIDK